MQVNNTKGYTWKERQKIKSFYDNKRELSGYKYAVRWRFSPLEYQCWAELRSIPEGSGFWPEYPIGKYFVDFADPVHKIVIECDGAQFHADKEKDKTRQLEIESLGWTVIRFNAAQILSDLYGKYLDAASLIYESDIKDWLAKIDAWKMKCMGCYFRSDEFKKLFNKAEHEDISKYGSQDGEL